MITIRPVTTIEQCQQIGEIEMAAWGGKTAVPSHILLAIAHHQGAALMAYDGDQPVGFCLSFVGFVGEHAVSEGFRLKHHSHMAGVLPSHQSRGIGAKLKWAQRDFVLAQQIELMTWTFDPLETQNGRLNIHKLGTVCNHYIHNMYGIMDDALNAGIASDRFEVNWWLASEHVVGRKTAVTPRRTRAEWQTIGVPILNTVKTINKHPHPLGFDSNLLDQQPRLLVAIPSSFQAVKRADLQNGIRWRTHTHQLFEDAFAHSFTVTDLIYEPQLSYYLLEKNWQP